MEYHEWKFYLNVLNGPREEFVREWLRKAVEDGMTEGTEFVMLRVNVPIDLIPEVREILGRMMNTADIGYSEDMYEARSYVSVTRVTAIIDQLLELGIREFCTNNCVSLVSRR